MTLSPADYADAFAYDLHLHTLTTDRAEQQAEGRIGFSDFDCPERMRRIIAKVPPSDSPSRWSAFVGSALDKEIKEARRAAHPELIHDVPLKLTFPNGYEVTGHPDELDPTEPSYTDFKTKAGLALERRTHTADQARIQRHLNFLAAYQNGVFPQPDALRIGVVRNVSVDRSGKDDRPHVEQEPFSADIVNQAYSILTDVLYAVEHGEEARKDRPRHWCRMFCQHFTNCRGSDAPEAFRRDDEMAQQAALRVEALETSARAEQLRAETKDALDGFTGIVEGKAGRFRVRTVHVNASTPHTKVEVQAL